MLEPWYRDAWGIAKRTAFTRREVLTSATFGIGTLLALGLTGTSWPVAAVVGLGVVAAAILMLPGVVFLGAAATYRTRRLHRQVAEIVAAMHGTESATTSAAATPVAPEPVEKTAAVLIVGELRGALATLDVAANTARYPSGESLATVEWSQHHTELAAYPGIGEAFASARQAVQHLDRIHSQRLRRALNDRTDTVDVEDRLPEARNAVSTATAYLELWIEDV